MDVVVAKRGDCSEHAVLFTALARAAGIPARAVGGVMYMGDEVRAFGWHAWNEVVLDGHWVEVDPTWNQISVDATHIAVGSGDQASSRTSVMLGGLRFKVVSVERRD